MAKMIVTSWEFWQQLKAIIPNLPMDNVISGTIDCNRNDPVIITTEQYAEENGSLVIENEDFVTNTKTYSLIDITETPITYNWVEQIDISADKVKKEIDLMYFNALGLLGIVNAKISP